MSIAYLRRKELLESEINLWCLATGGSEYTSECEAYTDTCCSIPVTLQTRQYSSVYTSISLWSIQFLEPMA